MVGLKGGLLLPDSTEGRAKRLRRPHPSANLEIVMAEQGKGAKKDLALVFGQSEDGEEVHILRRRADSTTVEAGTLRPLREGKAITGEVVHLEPREDEPMLFDCETDQELSGPAAQLHSSGPP